MSIAAAVSYLLDYLIVVPSLLLCWYPLQGHFKRPARRVLWVMSLLCVLGAFVALGVTWLGCTIEPNTFLLVMVPIGFVVCHGLTNMPWYKEITLFADVMALMSFSGILDRYVDAWFRPSGTYTDVSTYGLAAQWTLVLLLVIALRRPLTRNASWLLSSFDDKRVWCIAWLVPLLILFTNLMMVPEYNATMHVGRVYKVSVVMTSSLFLLLMAFNCALYMIARSVTDKLQTEQKAELLAIQADQYEKLKDYMEKTAQLRHDFRHSVHMLSLLLEEGQTEEAAAYLKRYDKTLSVTNVHNFCANPALNALLNYYAEMAEQNGVAVDLRIELPESTVIEEAPLCSMTGNLLENAIQACQQVEPKSARFLHLSIRAEEGDELYIASENAFSGELKQRNGLLLSTKHKGEGVGLKSVRTIAEQYHGRVRVYTRQGSFCVDVCLRFVP